MRFTSLTTLFFALFALFSTLAYAAPISKRDCMYAGCRFTGPSTPSTTDSSGAAALIEGISALLTVLKDMVSSSSSPAAAFAVPAADPSSPSSIPIATPEPTGV